MTHMQFREIFSEQACNCCIVGDRIPPIQHPCMHASSPAFKHTFMHAIVYASIRVFAHATMLASMHSLLHASVHVFMHRFIHSLIHASTLSCHSFIQTVTGVSQAFHRKDMKYIIFKVIPYFHVTMWFKLGLESLFGPRNNLELKEWVGNKVV